ncbi:hypothetical protein ABK040_004483 [Willaertia magna]
MKRSTNYSDSELQVKKVKGSYFTTVPSFISDQNFDIRDIILEEYNNFIYKSKCAILLPFLNNKDENYDDKINYKEFYEQNIKNTIIVNNEEDIKEILPLKRKVDSITIWGTSDQHEWSTDDVLPTNSEEKEEEGEEETTKPKDLPKIRNANISSLELSEFYIEEMEDGESAVVDVIPKVPCLERIELDSSFSSFSDLLLDTIADNICRYNLQFITITGQPGEGQDRGLQNIKDEGLENLCKNCINLKHIEFDECLFLEGKNILTCLKYISERIVNFSICTFHSYTNEGPSEGDFKLENGKLGFELKNLEKFVVDFTGITYEFVEELVKASPKLGYVSLSKKSKALNGSSEEKKVLNLLKEKGIEFQYFDVEQEQDY